ncbi:MAG: hemolysin III family protein [Clostridia bacterium]|nr:hemolysin III family protein [Clostridia bacterium]
MLSVLPTGGVWLLVAGGVAYTVGIMFYRLKTVPYTHAVWHLFVLLGATLQYFSLYGYVFG